MQHSRHRSARPDRYKLALRWLQGPDNVCKWKPVGLVFCGKCRYYLPDCITDDNGMIVAGKNGVLRSLATHKHAATLTALMKAQGYQPRPKKAAAAASGIVEDIDDPLSVLLRACAEQRPHAVEQSPPAAGVMTISQLKLNFSRLMDHYVRQRLLTEEQATEQIEKQYSALSAIEATVTRCKARNDMANMCLDS